MNGRLPVAHLRRGALVAVAWICAAASGAAGCTWGDTGAPWNAVEGGGGASFDPAGGAPSCDADCPAPPEGWSPPALFAFGPFTEVPACPDVAPYPGIEAYADLQAAPATCPVCQCGPSETTCDLPLHWTAAAADCAGASGAEPTAFNAPAGWDGECTPGGIAAGAQCGGAPCVQSLTVEPPSVAGGDCAPQPVGPASAPPPAWGTRARECRPAEAGACPEIPGECAPPSGFSLCTHRSGDVDCPDRYPHKQLFQQDAEDARACSPCTCGAPEGNTCTVLASAFQDGACGVIAGALLVTAAAGDGCVDIPPGLALGGKTAEIVATRDGACAPSGGEPLGDVTPSSPITVCCRQDLPAR